MLSVKCKNHNEILLHINSMSKIKKTIIMKYWRGCGANELPHIADGNVNGTVIFENYMAVSQNF